MFLTSALSTLDANRQLATDAVHFGLLHELGELAKVVPDFGEESVGIIHGDRMQKLLGSGDLEGADRDENYNDCTLEYIIMPLIDSLHISLGIMERKENDTLYIMDSLTLHKDRVELHRNAAIRLLSSKGTYDSNQLTTKHIESSQQTNCYDCGIFAIRYFRVFFEYSQNEVDVIVDYEIDNLRRKLHEAMSGLIRKPETKSKATSRASEQESDDDEVPGKKKVAAKKLDFESSDDEPLLKGPAKPTSLKKFPVKEKASSSAKKGFNERNSKEKVRANLQPEDWESLMKARKENIEIPQLDFAASLEKLNALTPLDIAKDSLGKLFLHVTVTV